MKSIFKRALKMITLLAIGIALFCVPVLAQDTVTDEIMEQRQAAFNDFKMQPRINPGSSNIMQVDYYSRGFSFPWNFPVAEFAGDSDHKWVELVLGQGNDMQRAYCIEYGKGVYSGNTYGSQDWWGGINAENQQLVNLILSFGYHDEVNEDYYMSWQAEHYSYKYIATQVALWNVIGGYWDGGYERAICEVFFANAPGAMDYYNGIKNDINTFRTIPSFATKRLSTAPTYDLTYNANNGKYEIALTDNNNVLGKYDFGFPRNGNSLNVSIDQSSFDPNRTFSGTQNIPNSIARIVRYWFTGTGGQSVCTSANGLPDPVNAYFKLKLASGNLKLIKTSEDNVIENVSFRITGAGINETKTTDKNGEISMMGIPSGSYTVQEVNIPDKYVKPPEQQINLAPGQTTTINFTNTIKKGDVKFAKKCNYSNSFLSGAKYKIYTADGSFTGRELTTKANEWVYSNDILYGDYYLQETTPPTNYALDDKKYPFSITQDKQTIEITADNTPLADVYPEFIAPNSNYRAGTEVVASYYIYNDSIAEHAPDRPLTVNFEAYYVDGAGTKQAITAIEKQVICPRFEKNLEYFKVPIQAGIDNIHFTCTVQTPNGVIEPNTANNTQTSDFSVSNVIMSQTPDTAFENKPAGFRVPSESVEVPTGNLATSVVSEAVWQQWTFDTSWTKKNYGVKLSAAQEITPDGNSPSYHKDGDKWVMKSGYGFNLLSKSAITTKSATELPTEEAYTLPQNGNAFFPEFQYSDSVGKYRTLELTAQDSLELEKNQYSITESGTLDYRRIHFSPLYFPDKNYTVKTYIYDCWTPAGMLSVKDTLKPIKIDGDMYEDWIVNHIDKK